MSKIIKIFFFGIMLISFHTAQSQIVGKIVNGKPVIKVSQSELINNYNTNMNLLSDSVVAYTSVQIIEADSNYYLVFYSHDNSIRSSLLVLVTGANNKMLNVIGSTSCTTKDYSSSSTECVPKVGLKSCTPCNGENGDCTRITTSGYSLILKQKM